MAALGLCDREDYLGVWPARDEQQELIEEVVIPESWFFRDDRPYAALRGPVRPIAPAPAMKVDSGPPLRF